MISFKKLKKTFFIAEIGNNHEGDFRTAIKLIDKAKESGADAVKFQTYDTNYFINKSEIDRFNTSKSFELTQKEFNKLSIYSKKKGLKFVSTPLDINSAKFLSKIVDIIKISSGDNNFYELIKLCASFKKPLIISLGMINFNEVKKISNLLSKLNFPKNKLAFLHCVSNYPVEDHEANLLSIKFLKDKFLTTIGYSDHLIGIESCLAAITLGAKIIEKHFTLDNNFSNFRDHKLSLNPKKMTEMINASRRIENMLGGYFKKISSTEKKNLPNIRRSIYFDTNLRKGTIVKRENLKIVRPLSFTEPNDLSKIIGRKLKKDVKNSEAVRLENIKS